MRSTVLKVSLFALLLASGAAAARAQSVDDERKFEVGAQVTALGLTRFVAGPPGSIVCVTFPCLVPEGERYFEPGLGGRLGYNLNRSVAVEAELNFFPRDDFGEGGRKVQGLVGVKAGRRFERAGVFAKARPGFLYSSQGDLGRVPDRPCIAIFPPPAGCFDGDGLLSLAVDLGGVVELYPTSRTIVRFDAGDTILRHPERRVVVNPPAGGDPRTGAGLPVVGETTHNFQASVGLGFRF